MEVEEQRVAIPYLLECKTRILFPFLFCMKLGGGGYYLVVIHSVKCVQRERVVLCSGKSVLHHVVSLCPFTI